MKGNKNWFSSWLKHAKEKLRVELKGTQIVSNFFLHIF